MRAIAWVAAALLPCAALAQGPSNGTSNGGQQPSVQVGTEAPHRGSLPRTIDAYGTVQAAPDGGSEAMSLLRGGQVTEVLTAAGQTVHKGQKLLVVQAGPAAVAAYRQAESAVRLAQGDRMRATRMLAQHLATRDQVAAADKAAADAQATLDALNRAGGASAQQTLTAPFDGVVVQTMVTAGERVAAQAPLLTLARLDRLVASVGVEPMVRDQVATGQPAAVAPLYGSKPRVGHVSSVGAMLDPATRLVPLVIGTTATPGSLVPGSPVHATVQVGLMTGWLVPRDAVLTDAKGAYVFQVDGATAARVDVRVVGMRGGATVVDGPIDPKRPLVTAGNYQLQDGTPVRVAKPNP